MVKANKRLTNRFGNFAVVIMTTMTLILAACTTTKHETAPVAEESQNTPPAKALPEGFEGDGMEIPLDGTSLPAFYASLAQVKEHTSPESYLTLENAIDYLLVYDLGAKRDRKKLAARLNGLTGYDIIAKVGWRKPAPGKSQAEKGATDVKIIDT